MRILQIITLSELGGAQSVVVNLANILSYNHEVIVAAGEGDGKMFPLLNENIKVEHIPNLVRKISPKDEFKAILQMRHLYNQYKPHVIHLHSSKAGILGRIAFPKGKIVYTVHGFDSIRIAYRKFLPIERLLQYRCAAIVGVSRYDERNLLKEGVTRNVSTVYNGIFTPSPEDNILSKFNSFKHKVLCIARLTPQKNHNLFLKVASSMPDCAFIWIGNQRTPDFDIPRNVFFLGNIPNAGAYTKYADVFMLPSNYEGLPMVIIESLSEGTPVVASAVGGIVELLDGTNGYAVPNDYLAMKETLNYIFNLNEEQRSKMKEAALATYHEKFTVDLMADNYLQIYNKILNRK